MRHVNDLLHCCLKRVNDLETKQRQKNATREGLAEARRIMEQSPEETIQYRNKQRLYYAA